MTGSASFVAGAARGSGLKVYDARTIRDVPQVRSALSDEALFRGLIRRNQAPDFVLDRGHVFGSELSDDDKRALIAFLKTL